MRCYKRVDQVVPQVDSVADAKGAKEKSYVGADAKVDQGEASGGAYKVGSIRRFKRWG